MVSSSHSLRIILSLFFCLNVFRRFGVSAIKCYDCRSNTTEGCETGQCQGDFCIDSLTYICDKRVFTRGCGKYLGYNPMKLDGGWKCGRQHTTNGLKISSCFCDTKDFCAAGDYEIAEDTGKVGCFSGLGLKKKCKGDYCTYQEMDKQKYGNCEKKEVDFDMPARCVRGFMDRGEKCTCNTDKCNNKRPPEAMYDRPKVNCHYKGYMDRSKQKCSGNICYLAVSKFNVKDQRVSEVYQGCMDMTGNFTVPTYCQETETGDEQYTICFCTDEYCNGSVEIAVDSVKKANTK